jgi:hypothetical protein
VRKAAGERNILAVDGEPLPGAAFLKSLTLARSFRQKEAPERTCPRPELARDRKHRAAAAERDVASIEVRTPAMHGFKLDFWSRAVTNSLSSVAPAA